MEVDQNLYLKKKKEIYPKNLTLIFLSKNNSIIIYFINKNSFVYILNY